MTPEKLSKFERWQVETLYWSAEKCASDLSRGCAELQDQRDRLRAENARLRAALTPMTEGTHWITDADVETARAALEQKP